MRPDIDSPPLTAHAAQKMTRWRKESVDEVRAAVAEREVVVVGMKQNPHPKRVRKALDEAGVVYTYLEYGSYLSKWKPRLAIKLWSGWPTFPQVEERSIGLVLEGDKCRAQVGEERADLELALGPHPAGGFLGVKFVADRTPMGPSVAPRVVAALAWADAEWDLKIGALSAPPDLRPSPSRSR